MCVCVCGVVREVKKIFDAAFEKFAARVGVEAATAAAWDECDEVDQARDAARALTPAAKHGSAASTTNHVFDWPPCQLHVALSLTNVTFEAHVVEKGFELEAAGENGVGRLVLGLCHCRLPCHAASVERTSKAALGERKAASATAARDSHRAKAKPKTAKIQTACEEAVCKLPWKDLADASKAVSPCSDGSSFTGALPQLKASFSPAWP